MSDTRQLEIIEDVMAAVRGCSWDGSRALTLRLFDPADRDTEVRDTTGKTIAPETVLDAGPLPLDLSALSAAYKKHLHALGNHPGAVRVGQDVLLLGRNADKLGSPAKAGDADTPPVGPDNPYGSYRPIEARGHVIRDKIVLITGGAQGFGLEIARGLATGGAQVILADLNLDGAEQQAAALNKQFGSRGHGAVAVNVTDEDSVRAMVQQVVRRYGGIDLVVSNAGVLRAAGVRDLSLKDFQFVTSVNYTGFFLVTKHTAPVLALQNAGAQASGTGSVSSPTAPFLSDIVEINSKSGLTGSNRNGAYAGSKFGGIGLVQSFAMELVEDNIKVNAICPGNFLDGPLWSDPENGLFVQYLRAGKVPGATTIADVRRAYEARVPMNRGCTGLDVVRAILYVVEQRYETGQAVPVTGGQEMLR